MAEPPLIEIGNASLSATINPFGAELTHLEDADGRELMTDADPAFWARHAPILFPVIGVTNGGVVRVDGVEYPMPKHGFARDMAFNVVVHTTARAVFRLTDSEQTRAHYPFAFALEIAFALDGATLTIEARIANRSDGAMPAQFGFHPALAWPLPYGAPRDAHRIRFERDEPEPLVRIGADGLIADERRPSPVEGRDLPLRDDLFADDALVFDPVRSQRVRYGPAQGPGLDVAFPDTPRLGIWTKPGASFVCIEPWHGLADPEGFAGELSDKPGVFVVAPGAEQRISMSVTLVQ